MRPFVVAELRARRRMLAGLAAGAFVLLLIIGISYESLALDAFGSAFGAHPPRGITAFSGSHDASFLTPHGWMGFGFNHPMFLVVTLTVAIAVGTGAIAGEVESGRGELLFTAPLRRTQFLGATLVVWLLAELAVVLGGTLGAITGALTSTPLRNAGIGDLLWAPLQYLPLAFLIAACAFAASAMSATRGRATGIAAGAAILAYLVNVISGLIPSLDWLRWLTPFGYYEPGRAMEHGLRLGPAALLIGLGAALLVAARAVLLRRDLA